VNTLIDSSSFINLLDSKLAKELDLPITLTLLAADTVSRSVIDISRRVVIKVTILNSFRAKLVYNVDFIVTRCPYTSILLGMPWLEVVNLEVDYKTKTLRYRKDEGAPLYTKVDLESA